MTDAASGEHAGARAALLELEDVSRVYGEQVKVYALREVSLQICAGDFLSIVGPSGSGKSTMLGLLGVLDLPDRGHGPRRGPGRHRARRRGRARSSAATRSASSSSSSI